MRHDRLTPHHRRPTSVGGTEELRNISWIKRSHHSAWHVLFGNFEPEKIAEIINGIYLDPDWVLVAQKVSQKEASS